MTTRTKIIAVVGAVVLLAVSVASAYLKGQTVGVEQGQASAVAQVKQADALETRIMDYVLKRNPDATIRDFSDFPRILLAESAAAGFDFRIVMALIDKESQFNPRAIGKAGEIGLMQVLPATGALVAKSVGLSYEPAKGTNLGTLGVPRYNLRIGVKFLKDRVDEFGGVNATALRAYNRGSMTAREHRPLDRYAEDIAITHLMITQKIPQASAPAPVTAPAPVLPAPAPVPIAPTSPSVAAESQYTLVARTSEKTWMRVQTSGKITDEIVPANAIREWKSNNPIVVSVGNAGGVSLELNGKTLPRLGERGQVVSKLTLPEMAR